MKPIIRRPVRLCPSPVPGQPPRPCPVNVVSRQVSPVPAFGGPASGLWSNAGFVPAPAPTPTPPAPAPPSCVTADILTECFTGCTGLIPPGSVCGWTFDQAFGPKGGTVTFTPGIMSLNMVAFNNAPGTKKSAPFATVNSLTYQFTFREFAAPTGAGNSFYQFFAATPGLAEGIEIDFIDDGSLFVGVGPAFTAGFWLGAWTPNNGTHTVHLTVDSGGTPTIYVDGVLAPLLFLGNFGFFILPGPGVAVYASADGVFPDSALVTKMILQTGVFPPTAQFCCP